MSSFTSLLSSINGKPAGPQGFAPNADANTRPPLPAAGKSQIQSGETRLVPNNTVAGVKRRSDESTVTSKLRNIRVDADGDGPRQSPGLSNGKPSNPPSVTPSTYRGTARTPGQSNPAKPVPKPAPRPNTTSTTAVQSTSAAANGPAKPKRGFASVMEKAKAAQEAAKVEGTAVVKQRPVEKISRREQARRQEEANKLAAKAKANTTGPSASRKPKGGGEKGATQKKAPEVSYKGTMKKQAQELSYKGTMNARPAGTPAAKKPAKKGMGQDKYGGYASWSDLDDMEDDEEDYESDVSSDMEGGFDDMQREENEALRFARKEDQQALEEEERHRKEKLERKKKLHELSKSAAARKKY